FTHPRSTLNASFPHERLWNCDYKKNGQGRTVACSIHERLKYGVIHYTTSKSLASQLPLSVFINRFWFCSLLYSLPGSWCLNSVLTAFSLSIERCSVYLGFWTVMVFVLFWCNF
ncbi:unnamed protein product, partial [Brassica oleracea]